MFFNLILHPPDHGPIYRETTDLSLFIVEPWNAWSSLTFLIPAFVFLWQLRGQYASYAFFVYFCSPMLILGGLGSTFFHAFRSSGWLLAMDVLPIVLLVLGISMDLAQSFAEKMVDRPDLSAVCCPDMALRAVPPRPGPYFRRLCRPRTDAAPALLPFPETNRFSSVGHLFRGGSLFCAGTYFSLCG